ncbi:MAG: hypothetical protein P1V35_08705 [Planctomycetota bacterium]|nr:hypothetical protein [Planctomycetota bacterium]
MSVSNRNHESSSILFLGTGRVEWIPKQSSDRTGYVRGDCEDQTSRGLAKSATELLESAGHKPGKCTLVLGGSLVRQRIISLAQLSDKETKAILHRKAANILEVELHQTAFTGLEMEGQDERRWLISAVRLDELRALKRDLRDAGFQVRRIVFGRLALFELGMSMLPAAEEKTAGIVIGVEGESVAISLAADGKLVQQTVVPGHFQVNSTMAASVLQELRGFESHWRRQSRGGNVQTVVIAGLNQDEAEHFELACHAALPDSTVLLAGDGPKPDREQARAEYLSLCATQASPSGNFTLPSRPRVRSLAAVAVMAMSLGLYLGFQGMQRLEDQRASLSIQTGILRSHIEKLGPVDEDLDQEQALKSEIAQRRSDLQAIGSSGLNAEEWLGLAFDAFAERAILDSIHMDDTESSESFTVSGRVPSDPVASVDALTALSRTCRSYPGIRDFELHLPTAMKEGASSKAAMSFRITAGMGDLMEGLTQ